MKKEKIRRRILLLLQLLLMMTMMKKLKRKKSFFCNWRHKWFDISKENWLEKSTTINQNT